MPQALLYSHFPPRWCARFVLPSLATGSSRYPDNPAAQPLKTATDEYINVIAENIRPFHCISSFIEEYGYRKFQNTVDQLHPGLNYDSVRHVGRFLVLP